MKCVSVDEVEFQLRGRGKDPALAIPGGPLLHPSYLGDLGGLSESWPLAVPVFPRVRVGETVAVLESVREQLGAETVSMIAHSAGAVSALCYLAEHSKRVRRLILITPAVSAVGIAPDQEGVDAVLARRRAEPGMAEAMEKEPDSTDAQRVSFGTWGEAQAELAQASLAQRPERLQAYYADPRPERAVLQSAARRFQRPVAILRGEVDLHPTRRQAEELTSMFPNAQLFVVERAGHYPWIDNPARFLDLLLELKGIPA